MAFIDYYKIMGIPKDTPQKDIKAAYRKRTKQFHPDLHPNDPKAKAKFQALQEANEVLSDPAKRAKYDQYGEHWRSADFAQGSNGNSYDFEGFDFNGFGSGGFSDFFSQMFGHNGQSHNYSSHFGSGFNPYEDERKSANFSDREYTVSIDIYTALLGGQIVIQTPDNEKLKLKVKAGTQPSTRVRLKGKGALNPDGSRGNLVITYKVQLPTDLSERQKELLEQMKQS